MHEVCFAGWVPCSLATQPDHVFSAGLAPTSTSTCCWPWAAACVLFWLLCHGGLVVVVDVYCLSFLPHRQRVRWQGVLGLSLRCASRRRCCGWHSGWARLAAGEQQGAVQCQQRPAPPLVLIGVCLSVQVLLPVINNAVRTSTWCRYFRIRVASATALGDVIATEYDATSGVPHQGKHKQG